MLAYCDYVYSKRSKYFEEKKKLEEQENAGNPEIQATPMEQA